MRSGDKGGFGFIDGASKVGKFQHVEEFILMGVRLEMLEEMFEHEEAVGIVAGIVGE